MTAFVGGHAGTFSVICHECAEGPRRYEFAEMHTTRLDTYNEARGVAGAHNEKFHSDEVPHVVVTEWNTDHDGRAIDPTVEAYPYTVHGPFPTFAAAKQWMDNSYPDDTDIHEQVVAPLNTPEENA